MGGAVQVSAGRADRQAFLYGDSSLLSDEAGRIPGKCRGLFFDAFGHGLEPSIAGGRPGVEPWHGLLTSVGRTWWGGSPARWRPWS